VFGGLLTANETGHLTRMRSRSNVTEHNILSPLSADEVENVDAKDYLSGSGKHNSSGKHRHRRSSVGALLLPKIDSKGGMQVAYFDCNLKCLIGPPNTNRVRETP
jgi:hypothetical protein